MLMSSLIALTSSVSAVSPHPAQALDLDLQASQSSTIESMERRETAFATLNARLPADLDHSEEARARIRRAVEAALILGDGSEIARRLKEAASEAMTHIDEQPQAAALLVELIVGEVKRNLAFEPVMEAALPKGFPRPAPAGEIQVTEYPGYRRAQTSVESRRSNGAFFALFRHITSNDIAMTAPVEMTVEDNRRIDMAFLYGDPAIGDTGMKGRVAVQDVPPMTVVTMGVAGHSESRAIDEAIAALEDWLIRNSDRWQRSGRTRVMGYNGPSVPRRRQFSEVQVPVERVQTPRETSQGDGAE